MFRPAKLSVKGNRPTKGNKMEYILGLINDHPGIDAPLLCLYLNKTDIEDPKLRGVDLAAWLNENYEDAWRATCAEVDNYIDEGCIFWDDGDLYVVGYGRQGGMNQ